MSKSEWPELVGLPWKEAQDKIRKDLPNVSIQVVADGSPVTMDYNENRVRLSTNKDGKVTSKPMIG